MIKFFLCRAASSAIVLGIVVLLFLVEAHDLGYVAATITWLGLFGFVAVSWLASWLWDEAVR